MRFSLQLPDRQYVAFLQQVVNTLNSRPSCAGVPVCLYVNSLEREYHVKQAVKRRLDDPKIRDKLYLVTLLIFPSIFMAHFSDHFR